MSRWQQRLWISVTVALWLASALFSSEAQACTCLASLSPCHEVASSELVFIGTVESIDPMLLSRWHTDNAASQQRLNKAITEAQLNPSAGNVDQLKESYRKEFPNLEKAEADRLRGAKTVDEVLALVTKVMDRGMRVHFKVRTLFKREDDDQVLSSPQGPTAQKPESDDEKAKEPSKPTNAKRTKESNDEEKQEALDVWTPFPDCGVDFQIGETYLVYANNDESSDLFFTSSCTRTRRLSEAGADLPYLYFYKSDSNRSSQLEAFTTTDRTASLTFDALHDSDSVHSPVPGLVVELRTKELTRYALSDGNGRSIFDGLPAGDYSISVFAPDFPLTSERLAGPRSFHMEAKSCSRQILLLLQASGR